MACSARVLLAAVLTTPLAASQPSDAARVLAEMRSALGGQAIDAIKGFSVTGDEERTLGDRKTRTRLEWVCVLPDRFIYVREEKTSFIRTVDTTGFNGNGFVQLRDVTNSSGVSVWARLPPRPEYTESLRSSVVNAKRQFSRFVIALLGITPAYPLDATYAGRETIDANAADVLVLHAADGYEARLYVEATTHLPLMISWVGRADARFALTSADARTNQSLPPSERRLYFSDYKKSGGLTWPHRFKETVGGAVVLDTRLRDFKINPKIEPARFVTVQPEGLR